MIYRIRGTENLARYNRPPASGVYEIPIVEAYTGQARIEIEDDNGGKDVIGGLNFNITVSRGDIYKFTLGGLVPGVPANVFTYGP